MSDPHPPSRLTLRSVRKRFGATQALDGVNLEVGAGEVHAIIGENGAGKSTLVKILSGAHQADSGEMTVDGVAIRFQDPGQSRNAGIAMIYQELNLAPDLSAAENITLGREPHRLGWVNRRQQRQLARAALQRLGCEHLPLTTPVHRLSIAQRQMVEIARALQPPLAGTQYASDDCATDLRILILDEPTSSLTKLDVEQLFAVIKR